MSSLEKSTERSLHNRLAALEQQLATLAPAVVAEMKAIQLTLAQRGKAPEGKYLGIRSMIEAIELCLTEAGKPLPRRQIFEKLTAGGFAFDPIHGFRLLADAVNYHIRKGRLARFNPLTEKDPVVGFPPPLPAKKSRK